MSRIENEQAIKQLVQEVNISLNEAFVSQVSFVTRESTLQGILDDMDDSTVEKFRTELQQIQGNRESIHKHIQSAFDVQTDSKFS